MIARVSASRGEALVALGREEEAERACRDVIDWARTRHVDAEALPAVFCLAQMLWKRGSLAEAATELGAARAVASTHPTERGRRSIDMLLGMVALSRGDLIAAHDHIVVALRFRMTHGYHWAATRGAHRDGGPLCPRRRDDPGGDAVRRLAGGPGAAPLAPRRDRPDGPAARDRRCATSWATPPSTRPTRRALR